MSMTWLQGGGWRRWCQPWWLVAAALLVLSVGCSSDRSGLTPTEQIYLSSSPSVEPGDIFFDAAQYPTMQAVTVPHGDRLVMRLIVYRGWQITQISNPEVLRQEGAPHLVTETVTCVPEYKCGPGPQVVNTTVIFLRALRPGVAQVSASAFGPSTNPDDNDGSLTVTVTVT
jgi:hypothetical protein